VAADGRGSSHVCARIGMVTGQGLAGNFKQRFPSWLLRVFVIALLAANTINIAADLAGMADAAEMLSGINSHLFVVGFALLISWATVQLRYHQIANVLKWLVLVLFAYPSPRLWWGLIGPGGARYAGTVDAAYQR
jgi:Mn2+/Fe2+ NRAMP family transporter